MASYTKPSSRYSSYDSRSSTSSHFSDPSSSYELNLNSKSHLPKSSSSSRALVRAKSSHVAPTTATKVDPTNLTTMVKRFMENKKQPKAGKLIIPSDVIAQDLKKDAKRVAGFSALQKKLFGKGGASSSSSEKKENKVKALTEVKGNTNTRTLAMVLRSERELLSTNKEQEEEISRLNLMLENNNREVKMGFCFFLHPIQPIRVMLLFRI